MKRKWLLGLAALCMSVFAAVGLVGCGESGESPSSGGGTNTEQGGGTTTPGKVSLGLQYEKSTDGLYYIVKGIGDCKDTDIIIPSMYEGKPIKEIGDFAFAGCQTLTSVVIPDSVKTIGHNAFDGCYKLVEVYNKSDLNITVGSRDYGYVGYCAKAVYTEPYTSKLSTTEDGYILYTDNEEVWLIGYTGSATDLTLPSNVTGINQGAFAYCDNLTSVVIPDSVTSIGDSAFAYCDNLTSVEIGDSVETIDEYAFYLCSQLTSIEVSENNENYKDIDGNLYTKDGKTLIQYAIGKTATEFTILDSVETIGYDAFFGCKNLTSVVIGDSVETIGDWAFGKCDNLTSVVIPDSVKTIGEGAFYHCDNLTSVVIGDSVETIGDDAFYGCYKLVEVYNKSSLNITVGSWNYGDVGHYAKAVYTEPYTSKLSTTDDGYILYTDNNEIWLIGYTGNETDLTLPSNVAGIYQYAFSGCDNLTSVEIPDSVKTIGYEAFWSCYNLTSVVIGDSVEMISSYAFEYCYKLVEVYNKSDLAITAGSYDYGYVGYYAKEVYTEPYASKLSTTDDGYILYTDNEEVWLIGYTGNETDLTLPSNVTGINQCAFQNCYNLTSVVIPDSVKTIGYRAFLNCFNLTSVVIPDSVETIGDDAFAVCVNLTSVYYKGTVSDWKKISIVKEYNTYLTNATRYYYIEKEADVPTSGNYWHYVDGVPTPWEL